MSLLKKSFRKQKYHLFSFWTSGTAIEQIKAKNYPEKIAEYTGEIILVGISYDDEKGHSCEIERIRK
ncbi:MAG: hypothetical protein K5695_15110 [Oscillospiraceae bacterium]|nr:hypothetical protein [Oscillospiraceae bacterium]